ncbi:conserved Plasmodium protein, unknown function [Plasmodium ovale curtisi]|uniref:Uncharacterized protein n=1 Tax=Plasmodium ovale curtisi TaxID=864141 RepID=A0A1A8WJR0_PLAOA|nr:conserved Plasmodium protein, unknown function [Plasmodium ovale curtisi]
MAFLFAQTEVEGLHEINVANPPYTVFNFATEAASMYDMVEEELKKKEVRKRRNENFACENRCKCAGLGINKERKRGAICYGLRKINEFESNDEKTSYDTSLWRLNCVLIYTCLIPMLENRPIITMSKTRKRRKWPQVEVATSRSGLESKWPPIDLGLKHEKNEKNAKKKTLKVPHAMQVHGTQNTGASFSACIRETDSHPRPQERHISIIYCKSRGEHYSTHCILFHTPAALKPSSLRVRSDKNNFNDIINRYFPNRILKKGKYPKYIHEKDKVEGKSNIPTGESCTPGGRYYLSSRAEWRATLLKGETTKGINITNRCKSNRLVERVERVELGQNDGLIEQDAEHQLSISKEEHDVQKYKNKLHKKLWIALKRSNEEEFERHYHVLSMYPLKDEVSFSILLHGKLIISKGNKLEECFKILNEMKTNKIHCSLIRLNERLLYSYYELTKLNAQPNRKQWIKVLRTVWFTAAMIKARRQKFILRKVKNGNINDPTSLGNFNNIFSIHSLEALYAENRDPLLKREVIDGEEDLTTMEAVKAVEAVEGKIKTGRS